MSVTYIVTLKWSPVGGPTSKMLMMTNNLENAVKKLNASYDTEISRDSEDKSISIIKITKNDDDGEVLKEEVILTVYCAEVAVASDDDE